MKYLVIGEKNYSDRPAMWKFMDELEIKPTLILTSGTRLFNHHHRTFEGAEWLIVEWCSLRKIPCVLHAGQSSIVTSIAVDKVISFMADKPMIINS